MQEVETMQMQYSTAGLALTKEFEGLRLEAYRDSGGRWTIGYGHTGPEVAAGMKISQADADAILAADLTAAVKCVNSAVAAVIAQHQFDALVDFCFNVGGGNFRTSSLLKHVNSGDFGSAAQQFMMWVNVAGSRCEGLVRRRTAERAMFAGNGA